MHSLTTNTCKISTSKKYKVISSNTQWLSRHSYSKGRNGSMTRKHWTAWEWTSYTDQLICPNSSTSEWETKLQSLSKTPLSPYHQWYSEAVCPCSSGSFTPMLTKGSLIKFSGSQNKNKDKVVGQTLGERGREVGALGRGIMDGTEYDHNVLCKCMKFSRNRWFYKG